MIHPRVEFYEAAVARLRQELADAAPPMPKETLVVRVTLRDSYDRRSPSNFETNLTAPMFVGRAGNGTLTLLPVDLFEEGAVVASLAASGTLAPIAVPDALEILLMDDGRWVYIGRTPLPRTRRLPTFDLVTRLRASL